MPGLQTTLPHNFQQTYLWNARSTAAKTVLKEYALTYPKSPASSTSKERPAIPNSKYIADLPTRCPVRSQHPGKVQERGRATEFEQNTDLGKLLLVKR